MSDIVHSKSFMSCAVACATMLACSPTAPPPAESSSGTVVVERGDDCEHCTLDLDSLLTLGDIDDAYSIGDAATLAVVAGDCVVGPTDRDGELLLFADCRERPRPLARSGEGPGELGSIRALAPWRGDSIIALGYGRATVLSVATGAGRTFHFDPEVQGFRMVVLPAESLVVINSDRSTRLQFVSLRFGGGRGPVFGAAAEQAADVRTRDRVLGPSRSGQFWAATTAYQHRVELWTSGGQLRRVIDRTPPWFPRYDSLALQQFWAATAARQRPLPSLRAVRESVEGLLWVAAAVPARDWQPDSVRQPDRLTAAGERVTGTRSRLAHYDGVLEVLDARSGALRVSVSGEEMWAGFANDTLIYSRRETTDGVPQLVVYRMRLSR